MKELHSTAAGVIFLHGYKAQPVNAGGRRYAFELTPTDHELKHFFFHAQTETEKKRYVRVQRASMSKRKAVVFLVQCPRKCTNFQDPHEITIIIWKSGGEGVNAYSVTKCVKER